jgi:hypothetical protein
MANADGLRRQVRERAALAGARAAVSLQTQLRGAFGQHRKSGATQSATRVTLQGVSATRITYLAVADTPQAKFVNDGTPAHVITPRANPTANATGGKWPRFISGEPLLVFDWPKGGMHPARFRWVDHPGYKGDPWWDRTIERWPELVALYW